MTERRYTVIFGVAVLTATLATLAVYRAVSAASVDRPAVTTPVVVAAEDVPAGVPIEPKSLVVVRWPAAVAPPQGFATTDSLIGRVTRDALVSGSPVVAGALAPKGAAAGYEGAITPGHRAVSIRVSEAAGVSGLVRRDSRVDVLVTVRDDQGVAPVATVVTSDVRVLGVGAGSSGAPTVPGALDPQPTASVTSVVTLEVTPSDAARLVAAETRGTIQLVLRGYGSHEVTATDYPTNVASLPVPRSASSVAVSGGAPLAETPVVQSLSASTNRAPGTLPGTGRTGARTGVGRTAESVRAGRGGILPNAAPSMTSSAPIATATSPAPSGKVIEVPDAPVSTESVVHIYRGGRLVDATNASQNIASQGNAPQSPKQTP